MSIMWVITVLPPTNFTQNLSGSFLTNFANFLFDAVGNTNLDCAAAVYSCHFTNTLYTHNTHTNIHINTSKYNVLIVHDMA